MGNRGFTILELLMVLFITGILASIGFVRFNKTVKANQLEKEAWKARQFIQTAKPLAMKMDSRAKIVFTASVCSLLVDSSADGSGEWRYDSRLALNEPLRFGLPASSPPTVKQSSEVFLPSGSNVAGRGWDTCMSVSADAIGTINPGSIYVSSRTLPKLTYCISITASGQSFKMFKWTGSKWIEL
ncbi:MAG TPA: prepilin-type N-terminal cleavage/methylation domain-containing protein [Chitinispirillaceae bacterium]|nr:prepilin-type N-terminal cleavage/methylation domain-containing protein [Chitinispirillaceae bacterium]